MTVLAGIDRVAVLGGGAAGGGWAARFALNGVDVVVVEPDPAAATAVGGVVDAARRAMRRLVMPALPAEGTITVVGTPEDAAAGVGFVQDTTTCTDGSAAERLCLTSLVTPAHVVIGSSSTRAMSAELLGAMSHPERIVGTFALEPVYLLPLVEVRAGALTAVASIERAIAVYSTIGMHPVRLSGTVVDSVVERVVRRLSDEVRTLVDDGIATSAEIGDVIAAGPALRWALGDEPSDDGLVALIQALRAQGHGVGLDLDEYERRLFGLVGDGADAPIDPSRPLRLYERRVPTEWVDYNGHTNDSRYMQLSSEAGDRFLRFIGMDAAYLALGRSFFTVESHINYLAQSRAGDALYVTIQLVSHDAKRLRLFTAMHRDDDSLVATAEHMMLHVDTVADKASPMDPAITAALDALAVHHAQLPLPPQAGRHIGQGR